MKKPITEYFIDCINEINERMEELEKKKDEKGIMLVAIDSEIIGLEQAKIVILKKMEKYIEDLEKSVSDDIQKLTGE